MARNDPLGAFNFLVEWDGIVAAGFNEVTVGESESEQIEDRRGDEENTVRKIPGLKKFANVTLKRGITTNTELWDWRKGVMDGTTERKNLSIVLLDESRNEKVRWNLVEAWPCKWTGPELKGNANEIAIETLEICHEGITEMKTS